MSTKPILIIGGGPAGLEASRSLADLGFSSVLVEKQGTLGGAPIHEDYAALTPDMASPVKAFAPVIGAVTESDLVDVRTETTVVAAKGTPPNLEVVLEGPKGPEQMEVGAAIVSTGFKHFDPGDETQKYGYYEFDDVITLVDAERMFKAGNFIRPSTGKAPKSVCFIQCVGSRDRQIGNQWCSKVCCGIACKQAIEIREAFGSDCRVFVFYIDLRAYGFWEDELYWKAQEEHNVNFVRGIVTEVTRRGEQLVVKGEDTTMGRPVEVEMDVVVLSVGMEPSEGTKAMAEMFELPLESHGYIQTTDGCMNTVSTTREGIYVAGTATGPGDIEDAVSAAGLAAIRAASYVRKNS